MTEGQDIWVSEVRMCCEDTTSWFSAQFHPQSLPVCSNLHCPQGPQTRWGQTSSAYPEHSACTHQPPLEKETRRSILPCLWLLEMTQCREESPKVLNQFPWATDNLVSTQTCLMEYWSSIFSALWMKAYLSSPSLPSHCSEEQSDLYFKIYTKVTFNSWFC